jgi:hypothetical protein
MELETTMSPAIGSDALSPDAKLVIAISSTMGSGAAPRSGLVNAGFCRLGTRTG